MPTPHAAAVPLDYYQTDPRAWADAWYRARSTNPEIDTPEGLASWFATTIEVGRRASKHPGASTT